MDTDHDRNQRQVEVEVDFEVEGPEETVSRRGKQKQQQTEETKNNQETKTTTPTPLPLKQLIALYCIIFSEPVNMVILFPFIVFMVEDFGIAKDPSRVGFYVGLLASAFPAAQFVSSLPIGWLSDRVGRRPILLIGLFGGGLSMIGFGFSVNYPMAMCFRILAGLLNGNLGVAKSAIGELTDKSNQAKAISLMGLFFGLGTVIAPIVGGFLSDPAGNYPEWFGGWDFFIQFPYCLPCIFSGLVSFVGLFFGIFMFRETHADFVQPKLESGPIGSVEKKPTFWSYFVCSLKRNENSTSKKRPGILSAVRDPYVVAATSLYAMIAFIQIMGDELYTIWAVAEYNEGGIEFSSDYLGITLTIGGLTLLLTQLFWFPWFSKYMKPLRIFQVGLFICAPIYFVFPWVREIYIPPYELMSTERKICLWTVLLTLVIIRVFAAIQAFTTSMIVTNNSVTPERLGSANGLGQVCSISLFLHHFIIDHFITHLSPFIIHH